MGAVERPRDLSGVPALHHACAVGRRDGVEAAAGAGPGADRRVDPRRHQFSQARDRVGRRGAAILRGTRENRELPNGRHGGPVDGDARLDAGRAALSAGDVAHRCPTDPRPHSRRRALSAQVAIGPHAAATSTRRGRDGDRRVGGCRVRRQRHAAANAASGQTVLRVGGVVRSQGLPWNAGPRDAAAADGPRPSAHAARPTGRYTDRRSAGLGRHASASPVAARVVAQRHASPVARPLLCRTGHGPPTTGARADGSPPRCGCCVNATSAQRLSPSTTWSICPPPPRCAASCASRISAGRSSSNTRSSRTRLGSTTSKAAACRAGNVTWR